MHTRSRWAEWDTFRVYLRERYPRLQHGAIQIVGWLGAVSDVKNLTIDTECPTNPFSPEHSCGCGRSDLRKVVSARNKGPMRIAKGTTHRCVFHQLLSK